MNASVWITRSSVVAMFGLFAVGCGSSSEPADEESAQLAADGAEEQASSSQSQNFGNLVFSAISSQNPDTAATSLTAPTKLWPPGCVTKVKDATNPRVVHITFNDCTGPFGLVHLNGEETVTLSPGAGGALHADFASVDLTANGKPIQHTATADITVSGAERDVKWHGNYTRVNAKGYTVAHTSDVDIVVDTSAGCATSNGTAVTTVADREIDTTIKDVKLCKNANGVEGCPTGEVVHTAKKSGKSVTIEFDGSAQATVTTPKGTFDVPLVCTP